MTSQHRVRDDASIVRAVLDRYSGRYAERADVTSVVEYLAVRQRTDDEELLTEPILGDLLLELLGFPHGAFFPQLSKSGTKPDFTPTDLVAHPFVLDAKSSAIADLGQHEPQIRRYIEQRALQYGVLFNLRELRTYRRGAEGHDPDLSFPVGPLWEYARGESLATVELDRFAAFVEQFRFRSLGLEQRIGRIRRAEPWGQRGARGESLRIDIEYLVDRLRTLSRRLAEDAATQGETLDRELRFHPELEPALLAELKTLALDLEPGASEQELPSTLAAFRQEGGLAYRTWRQYLLRVSQLALTRILLYRSWEDAGFVTERLYDGGFGRLYEQLGQSVAAVLDEAFSAGRDRYPWLYAGSSTYDWYRPSDSALVDVLYTLLPVPLGKLDADVLGGLYESYVDEIDHDRLGQFYTPRAVVRFMLNRAGFSGADGVFAVAGDERRPLRVLDFATGSGGFLVETARRIVDEVLDGDARDLEDGLASIVGGLHGAEISPFPYYLTEVNLLLQVSRVLGRLRAAGAPQPRELTLGVVHADTLASRRGPDESFSELRAGERADRAVLEDRRFGLVPLDPAKGAAYERIASDGGFDLVVGNPPYVFESGNRALFERLRALPGWRDLYRGKGDYLYYFLLLAAERVAPGGRLCVITPAGWMNAGATDWLRERPARRTGCASGWRGSCASTSCSCSGGTASSRPSARTPATRGEHRPRPSRARSSSPPASPRRPATGSASPSSRTSGPRPGRCTRVSSARLPLAIRCSKRWVAAPTPVEAGAATASSSIPCPRGRSGTPNRGRSR